MDCNEKTESHFQAKFLSEDVSGGLEKIPITCINTIDDEPLPTDYVYINKNIFATDILPEDLNTFSCTCEQACGLFGCRCAKNSLICWYREDGRLIKDFDYINSPLIFECNGGCACANSICKNKVVQFGVRQKLQVFRTEDKGWGVRSLEPIPIGAFVSEYIGELVDDTTATAREDDSYIFDLNTKESEVYCIDAKFYGNISRFINHSCDANLVAIRTFIEYYDLRFSRIALFAKQYISPNEELGFNYGKEFWDIKRDFFSCSCKSLNCLYPKNK